MVGSTEDGRAVRHQGPARRYAANSRFAAPSRGARRHAPPTMATRAGRFGGRRRTRMTANARSTPHDHHPRAQRHAVAVRGAAGPGPHRNRHRVSRGRRPDQDGCVAGSVDRRRDAHLAAAAAGRRAQHRRGQLDHPPSARSMFELRPLGSVVLKGFARRRDVLGVVGEAIGGSRFAAAHEASLPIGGRDRSFPCSCGDGSRARRRRPARCFSPAEPGIGKPRLAGRFCAQGGRRTACAHRSASARLDHTNSRSAVLRSRALARISHRNGGQEAAGAVQALLRSAGPKPGSRRCWPNLLSITDDLPAVLPCSIPVCARSRCWRCLRRRC